jgi:predicted Zn-dependent peptidase
MNKIAIAFLYAVLLLPFVSRAQTAPGAPPQQPEPESVSSVELKGKVPVNPETLRVKLPRPQEAVLSNGLRIFLLEDRELPTFTLQLIVGGGGLADPPDKRGVAMVTAALLREGTKERTSREIAEQLAALGASFSAGASPSSGETGIRVSGLRDHLDAVLAIAADVIRNPAFPDDELSKFKSRFASQLQYQRSRPTFIVQEQFMRAIYAEHPGSYVVPPESVIEALTAADLMKYHGNHYKPNNAFLLAHGDMALKDLTASLERALGEWEKGATPTVELPDLTSPKEARVHIVDRPGSVQTSLRVGTLGIERASEDYFAVLVMNHILGGGPASRLFTNLREDKGYTYGVSSTFTGSTFPGVLVASTDVRTDVTEGALHELTRELQRLIEEPVPARELETAQRALVGRFALSLDSPQTLLSNLAIQRIYGFPDDYWDTYPQHVRAVTAKDIQRVAKKYLAADRLQFVAVGDAKSIRKTLEAYGYVQPPRFGPEPQSPSSASEP